MSFKVPEGGPNLQQIQKVFGDDYKITEEKGKPGDGHTYSVSISGTKDPLTETRALEVLSDKITAMGQRGDYENFQSAHHIKRALSVSAEVSTTPPNPKSTGKLKSLFSGVLAGSFVTKLSTAQKSLLKHAKKSETRAEYVKALNLAAKGERAISDHLDQIYALKNPEGDPKTRIYDEVLTALYKGTAPIGREGAKEILRQLGEQ